MITYPPIPIYELGPVALSMHGLFAAIGFLAGATLAVSLAGKRGFDKEAFTSILNWALVGAILGARYFTIGPQIADGDTFAQIINPLGGNFSILGGMLGGILAAALRAKMLDQPWWALVDSAAFGLAVGTIVGRIGDLAIVEHLGAETDFFLGYKVLSGYDLAPQHNVLECADIDGLQVVCGVYHPTWLYDMLGAMVLFLVLTWLVRVWKKRHYGQLFSFWVAWYGAQRFFIDFTRQVPTDQGASAARAADATLGPLTWSQWSGVGMVVLGLALMMWHRARQPLVSPENDAKLAAAAEEPLPDEPAVV